MSDDPSISRSVLADQVKEHLLSAILDGAYGPDARIVETRVARELGTSQAPVREALRGLEALGVVEILPFRGARVRRPTLDELLEAYEVRMELESLGLRLGIPRLTAADIAEIEALHEAMHEAAAQDDRRELAVRDAAFHARILRTAANATLERVWRSLEPFSRTYITVVVRGSDASWTAALHPPIMAAIRARDVAAAQAALQHHFAEASARLAREWVAQFPNGG